MPASDSFLTSAPASQRVGNVHEVVQHVDPDCRVVYVDCEPIAVAHSELLLAGHDRATIIKADIRDPAMILHSPATLRLIDFTEPVGLLMVGVVQFLADEDDPWALAARYRDALVAGSYLALSAFTQDSMPEGMDAAAGVCTATQHLIYPRSHDAIPHTAAATIKTSAAGTEINTTGGNCGVAAVLTRAARPASKLTRAPDVVTRACPRGIVGGTTRLAQGPIAYLRAVTASNQLHIQPRLVDRRVPRLVRLYIRDMLVRHVLSIGNSLLLRAARRVPRDEGQTSTPWTIGAGRRRVGAARCVQWPPPDIARHMHDVQ